MADCIAYLAVKSIGLSILTKSNPCSLLNAARHNLREIQAELGAFSHIDPIRSKNNIVISGPSTASEVQALADKLLAAADIEVSALRRDYCQAIEIVFSLPPQHGISDSTDYFKTCLQWSQNTLRLPVISAVIHYDEYAPHSHVLLLPVREHQYVGSKPIAMAELTKLRHSFFAKVAEPAGMTRPCAKVRGTVKRWATTAVLNRCQELNIPASCGPLWSYFQHCIEREPTEAMQLLGIPIATIRPRTETESNPIEIEATTTESLTASTENPIGIELEADKSGTLSCVGFDTPDIPAQLSRMDKARSAELAAIARHTRSLPTTLQSSIQPHEDGITRVRDEYSHDTSSWSD